MTDTAALMIPHPRSGPSRRSAWKRLRRKPGFLIPSFVIVLLCAISAAPHAFASIFGHGDPRVCDLAQSGHGPAAGHPFGFDLQGCDVYANVIYGTQTSLSVGLLTTLLALIVAIVVGTIAGFYGGIVDSILARITDVFLGFPFLLGAIVVLTSAGRPTVLTVSGVLALFGWPVMARLVRSSV